MCDRMHRLHVPQRLSSMHARRSRRHLVVVFWCSDPHQLLKKLLQFINVDVITGLVGQLINFEAILRHFSPPSAKKTTTTAASQPTVMMMSDQPPVPSPAPTAFPTLPPIPVTPEMEAGPVSDCLCASAAPSERCSRWEAADAKRSA